MPNITLSIESIEQIFKHAEETFPNECCGFLFGKDNTSRYIYEAAPTKNSKKGDQSRRFEISAKNYLKAELYALENNLELLGIYHSHPNHPAIASEHDLKVAMPFFSYIIVSVIDGKADKMMSWKLKDDKREFEEEKVLINATNLIY